MVHYYAHINIHQLIMNNDQLLEETSTQLQRKCE